MIKKILLAILINIFLAVPAVYANHLPPNAGCNPNNPTVDHCVAGYTCKPLVGDLSRGTCELTTAADIIGKVQPPAAIQALGAGSKGISQFLNNLITLIYTIGAVITVFMLLWGALEWILSGGNKESVANARNRIIHAIVGIALLAAAFAILNVVSRFTGINFFTTVGTTACEDKYYFDTSKNECVHKYATDNKCIYVFEVVDRSLCR